MASSLLVGLCTKEVQKKKKREQYGLLSVETRDPIYLRKTHETVEPIHRFAGAHRTGTRIVEYIDWGTH